MKPQAEGWEAVQSRAAAGQGQGGCRRRWSCGGWEAGGQVLLGMELELSGVMAWGVVGSGTQNRVQTAQGWKGETRRWAF